MDWLTYDVQPGHPLFGKLVRCDVCGAGQQAEYLQKHCGLTGEMLNWTFQTTRRNQANAAAYDAAQALAGNPQRLYTLLGSYGVGKTRLLACIVNAGRLAGLPAVYTTTAALLDYLRGAFDPNATVNYDGRWEVLTDARILAIDEFDRWNPTEWAREKFEQLIDERYRAGANKLTCFAANARLDDLPGYVASRMQDRDCFLYELTGTDARRIRR